jgi:hypothetical protein
MKRWGNAKNEVRGKNEESVSDYSLSCKDIKE